jgi:peptidoglycan/LPS O-acetylase OafA/YrhL
MTSTRYDTLTHWRGLACLLVVMSHSVYGEYWFPSVDIHRHFGAAGVAIFFVISGYCITAAVRSSRERGDSLLGFMRRRFWRIYPPYWAALVLALAVRLALHGRPSHTSGFWEAIGNLTLTESWRWHFVGPEQHHWMNPAWTLVQEEQFYLVCGLLLLLAARWYLPATIGLCFIVLATMLQDTLDFSGSMFAGFWLAFAGGVFVFYAIHGTAFEKRLASLCLFATVVGGIFAGNYVLHIPYAAAFAPLALALHKHDAAVNAVRSLHWLRWCGTISYGWYLTHWFAVKELKFELFRDNGVDDPWVKLLVVIPFCVAASLLLLAWPFHVFVERRFMLGAKGV